MTLKARMVSRPSISRSPQLVTIWGWWPWHHTNTGAPRLAFDQKGAQHIKSSRDDVKSAQTSFSYVVRLATLSQGDKLNQQMPRSYTPHRKETHIQSDILRYVQILENQWYAYVIRTSSGAVPLANGNFFKSGKKGCPDVTMCFLWKYIGVEIKKSPSEVRAWERRVERIDSEDGLFPTNDVYKTTIAQMQARDRIRSAGGYWMIVWSLKDFIQRLEELRSNIINPTTWN